MGNEIKLNKLYILIMVFALAIAQSDAPDDTSPPPEEEEKKRSFFKIFQKKDKSDEEIQPGEEVEEGLGWDSLLDHSGLLGV